VSDEKNNTKEQTQQPDQATTAGQVEDGAPGDTEAAPADRPEPVESEAVAADNPKPTGSPLVSKPVSPRADTAPPPAQKRGTSAVGWLALLLVIGLAAAGAWVIQQALQREADLAQRVAAVENSAGEENAELAQAQNRWRRQIDQALASMEETSASVEDTGAAMEAARAAIEEREAAQQRELAELREDLVALDERIASFSANDHQNWLRAEAQYLLRLANQRVIMARDVDSALALLSSADDILRQLDDPSLYEVRAAVAAEQAALRAVPRVDVEGIYLRLSALIEQAGQLVIFEMPEVEAQPEGEPADDWQTRLERGYEEAARKLSDYVVIRRRDVPMQALMDPQWEGLVRQNLRMLLEQAQVALLSGNQTLYEESLERAQHWVAQFFESDASAAQAMSREITQLSGQTISTRMPDITRSMNALDQAIRKRLQQGGEG
jgi:uroporphyrin-3 C-methyltransferase